MADPHSESTRSRRGPRAEPEPRGAPRARPGDAAASQAGGDADLARRCATGEDEAWEEFLERFGPLIQGIVRRALSRYRAAGAADEEDAFASVIEVLLRNGARTLRSFREPFNLGGWLTVLTRRQCRAFLEARHIPEKGIDWLDTREGGEDVVEGVVARESAARRQVLGRAVRELLGELPPRERLMIKLFYFDRRKYREIAAILRMPMGNVGKTLARALEKLKEKAEGAGWGPE